MFKSVRVRNFKSFKDEVVLTIDQTSNAHGLWGGNDIGKTNFTDVFATAYEIFHEGIRTISKDLSFLFDIDSRDSNSVFEFEFGLEGRMYRYGFLVNFFNNEITEEYLFRTDKKKEVKLFLKKQDDIQIGDIFNVYLSKEEKERLSIYLYDLRNDKKTLFVSHMKDKHFYHGQLSFFNDIHYFFNRMFVYKTTDLVYEYHGIDHFNKTDILTLLKKYDSNIEDIIFEHVTLDELRIGLGRHKYDYLMDLWKQNVIYSEDNVHFLKFYDTFLKLDGNTFDDLKIHMIEIKYINFQKRIKFEQLSSGLKQMIHLFAHITMLNRNALFVIDDLFIHGNPIYSKSLILDVLDILKKGKSKMIFTSHDMFILDQKIFSQNEISFLNRKEGITKIKTLTEYAIRHDKVINKAYLEKVFEV